MKLKYSVLLLCFLVFGSLTAQTSDEPLITVNETETTYAPVDEIHFNLSIRTHDLDITEVRNKNRKIAQEVFDYLDKKKVPKQYVQTKRMNVNRNYMRNSKRNDYDGFVATQKIYVCIKDINAFDEIMDNLLLMDIESIDGPSFKSSLYDETKKAAQLKALTKARKSAQDMAEALGQKIGKAKYIKNEAASTARNSAYTSASSGSNSAAGRDNSFAIGEIEIKASVLVSFELLD